MSSPEDWGEVPPPPGYGRESSSIIGRIGQQLANSPSAILNSIMQLGYGLGIREPEQKEAYQAPLPYDIPASKGLGEFAVDAAAEVGRSLPFFMSGEGAGVGVANLMKLGPTGTNVARLAGGFATQGLTESPGHAAVEGTLGGIMGGVERILPKPARLAAAAALGGLTYASQKAQGAEDKDAAIAGTSNAILPLLAAYLHSRGLKKVPTAENIGGTRLGYTPRLGLEDVQTARTVPGTGGPIPYGGELEAPPRALPDIDLEYRPEDGIFAPKTVDGIPTRNLNGEAKLPLLPPRRIPPEGSMIREPSLTEAEARRRAGIQPPEGSLIRNPIFDEDQARAVAQAKGDDFVRNFFKEVKPPPPSEPSAPIIMGEPEPIGIAATINELMRRNGRAPLLPVPPVSRGEGVSPLMESVPSAPPPAIPPRLPVAPLPPREPIAPRAPRSPEPPRAPLPAEAIATLQPRTTPDGSLIREPSFTLDEIMGGKTLSGDEAITKLRRQKPVIEAPPEIASMQSSEPPVATLQSGETATSSPSSLETVPPPEGINFGDTVNFRRTYEGEDEIHRGTISPGEEPGTYRLIEKNGTIHDVPPRDIITKPQVSGSDTQSRGNAAELQAAKRAEQRAAGERGLSEGGKQKLKIFDKGLQGSVSPEFMLRYVAAPTVGGIAGYAFPDDDSNRLGSAVAGAALAGLLMSGGIKVAKRLAQAHPKVKLPGTFAEKTTSFAEAVVDGSWLFTKAMLGNKEMARRAEAAWGTATDYDKLARWVEKMLHTEEFVTRMTGKARGLANDYGDIMHTSLRALARTDDVQRHYLTLNRYFEGKMQLEDLQRIVPKEVADLAAATVQAKNGLQKVVLEGMEKGALSKEIAKSFDSYVTTSYKIFHDPAYWPTDKQIQAAAMSLGKDWGTFEMKLNEVNNYLKEIKEGKAIWGEGTGSGKSLGAILTREKNFSPAMKDLLGEYKNPLQRMSFTAVKLVNGAQTAEYFNEVARGTKENGLKFAYGKNELQVKIATLQSEAKLAHTPEARAIAQAKLEDLQQYVRNTEGPTTGRLSNMYMDRQVRDQLANYAVDIKAYTGAWGNAILEGSNYIKYSQVILSPLQLVRQVYQMPILGMAARVNPFDLVKTGKLLFSKTEEAAAERQRLRRLGVYDGASQTSELRGDINSMLDGSFDRVVKDKVAAGLRNWENAWRTPDLMVRVAAFQKQEAKLLEKYGSAGAARATNEALDFMNRYTMNYAAIPPGTKFARQLPFVNQYLSFVHETMRITKNLTKDALKGDAYAIGVLGAMATAPFIIQQMSEAMLSPEDNKEWQKVKRLGRDYERHNFRFVQERLPNGDFRYVSFSPLVLHDPMLQMLRATMAGDTSAAWAVNPVMGWDNTPLLNIASSVVTGRNRFTGQTLSRPEDWAKEIRNTVAPLLLGTDLDRIQRAITPNSEGGMGVIDARSGKVSTLSDMLQNYVTSLRPYTARPSFMEKQAQNEALDRIRTQQSTYKAIANTNASPEVKEQARQNFENAKRQIFLSLQEKLGVAPSTAPNEQ